MITLAIDTAASACAACLFDAAQNRVLGEHSDEIGRGHAEHLLATIDKALAAASLSIDDIAKVAVSIGPGSFTGIRVGVAAARGLGLALDIPVVGVSTLEAIAADYESASPFAVAILACRNQAYAQGFGALGAAQTKPFIVRLDDDPAEQIGQDYTALIGNAAEHVDQERAARVLDRATGTIQSYASLGVTSDMPPAPLYIRPADAKKAVGFALPRQSEAIS